MTKELSKLREKIDNIDNQIINLLNERIDVVEDVAKYKRSINESFFIKSAREADMIKSLLLKASPLIPKSTIVNIWRKIITSSNCLEQELKISIHNPNKINDYQYLVREYYGDFVPLSFHDSISSIISEIENNEAQIGIFALPDSQQNTNEHWWINLANNKSNIKVFAKIPFIGKNNYQLVTIAKKNAEKSDDDKTLLVLEINKEITKHQVEEFLEKNTLNHKIIKSAKIDLINNVIFYLVEIEGFFLETDPQIIALTKSQIKPFIKVLGHFAKTIEE